MTDVDLTTAPLDEARERLGELLGLDRPVSEAVAAAAAADEAYARNLLATRDAPPLREHLLANPPEVDEASVVELGGRLAQAVVRWGRTGFTIVDDATRARRLAACADCPHRIAAQRHPTLHRWLADGERPYVCGLCGCSLARKTRLASESCPGEDPDHLGFDRWGNPHES